MSATGREQPIDEVRYRPIGDIAAALKRTQPNNALRRRYSAAQR